MINFQTMGKAVALIVLLAALPLGNVAAQHVIVVPYSGHPITPAPDRGDAELLMKDQKLKEQQAGCIHAAAKKVPPLMAGARFGDSSAILGSEAADGVRVFVVQINVKIGNAAKGHVFYCGVGKESNRHYFVAKELHDLARPGSLTVVD